VGVKYDEAKAGWVPGFPARHITDAELNDAELDRETMLATGLYSEADDAEILPPVDAEAAAAAAQEEKDAAEKARVAQALTDQETATSQRQEAARALLSKLMGAEDAGLVPEPAPPSPYVDGSHDAEIEPAAVATPPIEAVKPDQPTVAAASVAVPATVDVPTVAAPVVVVPTESGV